VTASANLSACITAWSDRSPVNKPTVINEPRRDHQSADMNKAPSAQGIGRDADNLSVADADVCARHSRRFRDP
jgi:hypothetical protein